MNSAELRSLTLSRLSRSARWAEERRVGGVVLLVGVGSSKMASTTVDEAVLRDLLADGSVVCDTSTRLVDGNPNRARPGVEEVIVKYYSVVNKE